MNCKNDLFTIHGLRKDFPMLKNMMGEYPLIYFDTAATAQKPQCVIDAMVDYYTKYCGTVHRGAYQLSMEATRRYSEVRGKIQQWIGASHEEEIIFTANTTDAINLVASCYGQSLKRGDEIVLSVMEHHSNIVPWQMLAKRNHLKIHYIPINEKAELNLDVLQKMLTPKTKIVSLAHIANSTGTVNPIKKIAAMAHAVGAVIFVDGSQAAPHLPLHVQHLDADFYAFSGHKIYGPTGIGVLYGKKSLLEKLPPYRGGGDMIDQVTIEETTYAPPPLRFEAGTPMIAEVIGLGAAIDYLEGIGMEAIAEHERALLNFATERLRQIPGLRIFGDAGDKGAIISFAIEGIHGLDLASMLDTKGVAIRSGHLCAMPLVRYFGQKSFCRVSFGLYNTYEEIERFIEYLREIYDWLK